MSWETQNWAMRQKPDHPSDKFVLIGMASCADANHNAFPSAPEKPGRVEVTI